MAPSRSGARGGHRRRFPCAAGEIHELKEELRSLDRPKKKEAVKKVIAAMTVGKDVSMLFPDVVNCMQTDDLELKKLVYLYLINYAKTQPDLAIMGVNTFVKVGLRGQRTARSGRMGGVPGGPSIKMRCHLLPPAWPELCGPD